MSARSVGRPGVSDPECTSGAAAPGGRERRLGGREGFDDQVQAASRLLDRDDRLVEAAATDVGDDDHQAAGVGWQVGPGLALLAIGLPDRVVDEAARIAKGRVEGDEGLVVAAGAAG